MSDTPAQPPEAVTQERLLTLELALAHAERAIGDLSDLVRDQQAQIDGLTRQTGALRATLQRLAAENEDGSMAPWHPIG